MSNRRSVPGRAAGFMRFSARFYAGFGFYARFTFRDASGLSARCA